MQPWVPPPRLCISCALCRRGFNLRQVRLASSADNVSARKVVGNGLERKEETISRLFKQTSERPFSRKGWGAYRAREHGSQRRPPSGSGNSPGKETSVYLRKELLKRDPAVLTRVVKDALNQMKSQLKTKEFGGDGVLRQSWILSPDRRYLSAFHRRMMAAFDADSDLRGERPLEAEVIQAIRDGFLRSRPTSIRNSVIDAYVHHIMVEQGYGQDVMSEALKESMFYPSEWYPRARTLQRQIHLHVGPTNSGKTYNALKKLEAAESGFYAGPLRLLAHEVYSRFQSKGISCGLVTGDEVKGLDDTPKITSHTVEMAPTHREVDVGVIDEIQMLADKERGWAWTAAFLGARAKELHLCGEERTVPLIREIAASMGDTLHIHRYERLNGLKTLPYSMKKDLSRLRKGDCVVCFSILNLHAMKQDIEKTTGRNCAIVYGSLPPEIRAQQARLFNDPNNTYDFLVASDAIGMGLNLSIKRIIFDSIYKFNGQQSVMLDVPALKQIAGRAGRYRSSHQDISSSQPSDKDARKLTTDKNNEDKPVGFVTTMLDEDLPYVSRALQQNAKPIAAAGLAPLGEVVAKYASNFPLATPYSYLVRRLFKQMSVNKRYFVCENKDLEEVSRLIDGIDGLSLNDKWILSAAPVHTNEEKGRAIVVELARCIATHKKGHLLDLTSIPLEVIDQPSAGDKKRLEDLVVLHKGLTLYIWLAYRFMDIFPSRVLAEEAKHMAERQMDEVLTKLSVDPTVRERMERRAQRDREQTPVNTASQIAPAASDEAITPEDESLIDNLETTVDQAGVEGEPGQSSKPSTRGPDWGKGSDTPVDALLESQPTQQHSNNTAM